MARKPRTTKAAKPAEAGPSVAKADDTKPLDAPGAANSETPSGSVDTGDPSGATSPTGADETPKPAAKTQAAPKAKPADDEPARQTFEVTGQIRRDKTIHRIGDDIDCTAAEFATFKQLGAIKGDWQE